MGKLSAVFPEVHGDFSIQGYFIVGREHSLECHLMAINLRHMDSF